MTFFIIHQLGFIPISSFSSQNNLIGWPGQIFLYFRSEETGLKIIIRPGTCVLNLKEMEKGQNLDLPVPL